MVQGNSKQGHLPAMIRDAYRFALSFGRIIEQAPLQAYSSALVFAPTGSLVKKYFEQEVPEWLGNRPTVEAEWDACLQTLEGHGDSVTSVVFLLDKAHLNNTTERPDQLDSPKRCLYGIAQDNSWVTCNSQKVLWLPPGYRPIITAIQNGVIAFTYQTGRVLIISFLDNV